MKVTKAQKEMMKDLIARLVLSHFQTVEISNPIEHRLAEQMVKQGLVTITKKKNYGRIQEIKLVA